MRVRPLAANDAERYRALMLHAYRVAPDAFTSTPEERAAQPASWWLRRIADPDGLSLAWGAFDGDALVGTVSVEFSARPKTKHKAHVVGMFVCAPARRLGVGKALLGAALEAATRRPDIRVATLTVTEGQAAALRLYESCGFRSFGVEPMAIATPGGFRSKVHMWLPLRASGSAAEPPLPLPR